MSRLDLDLDYIFRCHSPLKNFNDILYTSWRGKPHFVNHSSAVSSFEAGIALEASFTVISELPLLMLSAPVAAILFTLHVNLRLSSGLEKYR